MKKRNKKYTPKPVRLDNMGFAMKGFTRLTDVREEAQRLKDKNTMAIVAMTMGYADRETVDTLIAAMNITEALAAADIGMAMMDDIRAGMAAVKDMASKGLASGRFRFTGPQLQAVKRTLEIHDAQLDACTVNDLDEAIMLVQHQIRRGRTQRIVAAA